MLQLENLSKKYPGLNVIDRFSLSLDVGSFTVLIGPSGCGKSTLFDILMGISRRDTGDISWEGLKVPNLLGYASFMHQKDLLLPWLTLMENVLLPCHIKGSPETQNIRQAKHFFDKLDLTGFEGYYPSRVSGGMRQRCALVRTLMSDQKLILLDEPLSSLDAITRRKLQAYILQLQQEFGKTILMVTHDIEEALLLGDTVILLSGRPMEIKQYYRLKEAKPRSYRDRNLSELREKIFFQFHEGF